MSQVKKFQNGGTPKVELMGTPTLEYTPTELNFKKQNPIGSITIDGRKYEATPELIQALSKHLNQYGEMSAPLAGLTAALQNGENVVYDSVGNTISGMNGKWVGIDEKANSRRSSGASKWRRNWDATFDNDAHRFRNAVKLLSGFNYNGNNTPVSSNLTDIFGNKLWYKWKENSDGTKELLADDPDNLAITSRLNAMTDYLSNPKEEMDKKYKLAEWYDAQRMSNLRSLYETNKDKWNDKLSEIASRAKTGELNADDVAFLSNFNIIKPEEVTQTSEEARLSAIKNRFKNSGFDYNKWGNLISWDDNGNYWVVTPEGQSQLRNAFGGNGSYWFNDQFANSHKYNPNGQNDFLRGYFILGNRIYNQNDAKDPNSELSKILNKEGGFRDLNAGMRHNEADNLIQQLWGSEIGWNAPNGEYYSNWLDPNGNIYYRSRTGDYNWTGKNGNQQLIEYVEANPELADEFGYYNPQFKLTDAYGNVDLSVNGPEIIQGLTEIPMSGRQPSEFNRHKLYFSDNGNSEFDGRYLIGDAIDDNGNVSGAGFWINPNDPDSEWLFESSELSRYAKDVDGNAIRIPKEMSDIFSQNPDFLRKFQNNPELRKQFVKVMAGSINSGWRISTAGSNVTESQWRALGFTPEQAQQLAQIGRKYSQNWAPFKSSRARRRAERVVSKPILHKEGGKIEKDSMGNMVGSAGTINAAPTQIKADKELRDPGTFANFGKDKLQSQDWIELGAVLADAASIGLAFAPEVWSNVAAGASGMAGSTAGFVADIKRDGYQGSDLGQYGINLALDAVSFIPVIGGASKSLKVARNLKKMAPIVNKIMKAAALYGISNATVQSWDAIQKGNFNMRDLRAVVNALGGAAHIARAGIKKPVINKGETTYPTINLKAGKEGNALKLSESQFNTIKSKNPKTKDELASEIADILNKSKTKDAPSITKEQVMDTYDLDEFIGKKFLLFGKEKVRKFNETPGKRSLGSEYITDNARRNARHENYRKNLAGETTITNEFQGPAKTVEQMVPQGQWRPIEGRVVEGSMQNPNVMIAGQNGVYVPSNQVPAVPTQKRVVINEADKALPVVLEKRTAVIPGEKITSTHRRPIVTPITSGIIWERTPDKLTSPEEVIPIRPTNKYTWRPTNQPIFRKKGGILKGQSGFDSTLAQGKDLLAQIKGLDMSAGDYTPSVGQGGFQSDEPGKPFKLDLNPVMNWGRALYSQYQSDKQLKNWLDRPRYRLMSPNPNAPRFIDSGAGNAYDRAASRFRVFKPTTSDAIKNEAMLKQRQAQALDLELQGDLARSKEFGAYKSKLDEFINRRDLQALDIANQNNMYDWKHDIEDVQMKNANIAEKSKFFDQAAYATQDWYTKQKSIKDAIEARKKYMTEANLLQNEYNSELEKLKTLYNGDLTSDSAAQALRNLGNNFNMKKQGLDTIMLESQLSFPFYKKGGSVGKRSAVTYSRDPYPELLLQNAKSSTKLVEKLNDSVIKLILDTKPLHVS